MNIGIGFNCVRIPILTAIDLTQKNKNAGFVSVWVAEDGWITGRDAVSPFACIRYLTEKVLLGTNLIPVHNSRHLHPTALTAATFVDIYSGRFNIGIGAGAGWLSYPEHPHPPKLIRDAILSIRKMLVGQEYELDGKRIALRTPPPIYSWDLPIEARKRLPDYLGAKGSKLAKLVDEHANCITFELYVPATGITPLL